MKIFVIPNLEKQDSVPCTNSALRRLVSLGAVPVLDEKFRACIANPAGCVFGRAGELIPDCDVLLAIGGDGTILNTVTANPDKPVIGINTGRVGFLTQLEGGELDRLDLLVQGRYRIQERMMLEMEVGPPSEMRRWTALNDIILSRGYNKISELGIYHCGDLIVRHRADGVIFSTPTGSTGYSLSAGGAVVDPSLSAILLTAICPYSSFNRSLILPPDQVYTVHMEEQGDMSILVDGEMVRRMDAGQDIRIRQSPKRARLIDLGLRDFYKNLREKLILRR